MDFGGITDNLPVIISIVVIIILQFFMRRKRSPDANNLSIVQGLLSEARLNLRLTDIFSYGKPGKKFLTTSWKLYGSKLSFLDSRLETSISNAFILAEDCNQQISAAKKYKSTSYLSSVDISKLKDLMTDTVEGLEEWLSSKSDMEVDEASNKMPGMFDDFTGGR
ncbi:hypothetical protein ACFLYN_06725 [Chloroflexota bacterium]